MAAGQQHAKLVTQGAWAEKYVTDSHRAWLVKGEGGATVLDRSASSPDACAVIDWAGADRREAGRAMVDALRRDGFFRVANHGMSLELIEDTLAQAKALFELRGNEGIINKIQVQNQMRPEMKTARGYLGLLEEALNPKVGPDLKETFDYGLAADGGLEETEHLGPNLWPSEEALPLFRERCGEYIERAYGVADELLGTILLGLDVGAEDTRELFARPLVVNRLIAYPPQPAAKVVGEPVSMGAGSHIDYGALTMVYEDQPGLEVLGADSRWTRVPPLPGSFIVMPGFCLERLTNGLLQATPHRVQNHSGAGGPRRHSSTLFLDPNPGATVAPLPAFVTPERPAAYQACMAGHKGVLVGKAAAAATPSTLGYWSSSSSPSAVGEGPLFPKSAL